MAGGELVLVYEAEPACRERLVRDGLSVRSSAEVASYLAQSSDIRADLPALATACAARGIDFAAVELADAAQALAARRDGEALVWTLTDGISYFRGSAAPALARLNGLATFGSEEALFALCQDKFRSGAVLAALGLPAPASGLARDGTWLLPPPPSASGWFVKPNRLGAKIGIWSDSRIDRLEDALMLSRRVFAAYRDDVVVQPYLPGRNVRASFLAVEAQASVSRLGVALVDAGGDFQTMGDSLALYGTTGEAARADGTYREPDLVPLAASQPAADAAIRAIAARMREALGLRDVFSLDFRVEADDTVHLIEFEVCPGLPCFDFRAHCRQVWDMDLAEAMATAAASRLARR